MTRLLSVALLTPVLTAYLAQPARAQTPAVPRTYSFQGTASMMMPGMKVVVHRNGPRELIERILPAREGMWQEMHDRVLYDFAGHKVYSRDLVANKCTVQRYESPYAPMFDPIGGSGEQIAELAKAPPRVLRRETVNGIPSRVVEQTFPDTKGRFRLWLEEKYGFTVRWDVLWPGKPPATQLEIGQLSYAPSPAALFVPPPDCTPIGGVATATGGHSETTVEAEVSAQVDLKTDRTSGAPAQAPTVTPVPATPGQITAVRLRLEPDHYAGPCPGKVKLVAEITTDGPGTVWYQIMAGAVSNSPEGRLKFGEAGTRAVTVQGAFQVTPAVQEAGMIAAMEDAAGQRGETVSADPVNYNIKCTARAGAPRPPLR